METKPLTKQEQARRQELTVKWICQIATVKEIDEVRVLNRRVEKQLRGIA